MQNQSKTYQFEVCANGVESCLAAQEGGANRVELCAGIPEGGTTPSYGEIKVARRLLTSTRLHVIIRPRGGDFLYAPLEVERMEEDIRICRELGADGVVIGCLKADGSLDLMLALEQLCLLGVDRVLTSGQQPTAQQGISLLRRLNAAADGRITILAGCGVNEGNIKEIQEQTGVHEFHFSARTPVKSRMQYANPDVYMGDKDVDESTLMYTSAERVRATIAQLK